jgi:hypothetical protein
MFQPIGRMLQPNGRNIPLNGRMFRPRVGTFVQDAGTLSRWVGTFVRLVGTLSRLVGTFPHCLERSPGPGTAPRKRGDLLPFRRSHRPVGESSPVRTKHREGSPNSPVLARWIAVSSSISLMRWMARARQASSGRCFQQGRGERERLDARVPEMVGRAGAAAILPRGSSLTAWSCDSPHFQIMPGPGACGKPGAMPHSSRPRGTREQEDRKCTTDR